MAFPAAVKAADRAPSVFREYDHVRTCGTDYGERITAAGFSVRAVDPVAAVPVSDRARYGLRLGEPVFVCTKADEAQ